MENKNFDMDAALRYSEKLKFGFSTSADCEKQVSTIEAYDKQEYEKMMAYMAECKNDPDFKEKRQQLNELLDKQNSNLFEEKRTATILYPTFGNKK